MTRSTVTGWPLLRLGSGPLRASNNVHVQHSAKLVQSSTVDMSRMRQTCIAGLSPLIVRGS
jgi:hypothetical protein